MRCILWKDYNEILLAQCEIIFDYEIFAFAKMKYALHMNAVINIAFAIFHIREDIS